MSDFETKQLEDDERPAGEAATGGTELTAEDLRLLLRALGSQAQPAAESTTTMVNTDVDVQRLTMVAWISVVSMAVVSVTALVTRVWA